MIKLANLLWLNFFLLSVEKLELHVCFFFKLIAVNKILNVWYFEIKTITSDKMKNICSGHFKLLAVTK